MSDARRPLNDTPDATGEARLSTALQIQDPDDFYAHLVDSVKDLPPEKALKVSAKLILLLANHIGDRRILDEAIEIASRNND